MDHKRGSFSGKIGFVLSAAGASVGLGNIWRFPYLAAKYGGAIFLLVYIILAMTFGYTMIIAETSIGRMTGKSPVGAYKSFSDKPALRVGGWINAIIPILTVLYYVHAVIGGLAQLLQMVPGGRGGQPHHLCSQLQGIFHGHGVNAAYAPVEHNGAEHGEIVIAVHSLVVSVCQIGPVDGAAQVGLDDNGPGSHSNRCVAELKIVVSPCPQVRICVDVHINHALHGYFFHKVPPC